MIFDLHSHIGPRKGILYTGEDILAEMDQAGVDRACVFTQVEEIDNDYTASQVRAHPDRLTGFCMVNPWDPAAEEEMRRCYAELGMRGVKFHPVRQGVALDRHGVLDPFMDLCAQFKCIAFFHGASEGFNSPAKFEEMARAYPEVPIVIGHSGTPWGLDEAIDAGRRCSNLYYATSLAAKHHLRRVVDQLGPERVLLATDAPFNQFRLEIAKVRSVIDPELSHLILGDNLRRLLGESVEGMRHG